MWCQKPPPGGSQATRSSQPRARQPAESRRSPPARQPVFAAGTRSSSCWYVCAAPSCRRRGVDSSPLCAAFPGPSWVSTSTSHTPERRGSRPGGTPGSAAGWGTRSCLQSIICPLFIEHLPRGRHCAQCQRSRAE